MLKLEKKVFFLIFFLIPAQIISKNKLEVKLVLQISYPNASSANQKVIKRQNFHFSQKYCLNIPNYYNNWVYLNSIFG